jgi:hypothetical protein
MKYTYGEDWMPCLAFSTSSSPCDTVPHHPNLVPLYEAWTPHWPVCVCSGQSGIPHCSLPTTSITILFHFLLPVRSPFLALYWLPHSVPSYTLSYIYASFPSPFTSPWRWRQQGPLKCWYPTTILCGVTTQKTLTWILLLWFLQISHVHTYTHYITKFITSHYVSSTWWICLQAMVIKLY